MSSLSHSVVGLSRRHLLGASLAGATLLPMAPWQRAAAQSATPAASTSAIPGPAHWRTWHLQHVDELRPAAPGAASPDEIAAVVGYQANPTDAMKAAIATWRVSPANIPWSEAIMMLQQEFAVPGRIQARNLPLLHTALNDAALAAWDAQLAYARPGPAATDPRITAPSGIDPAAPTFPSAPAALAGAAEVVLEYLLPKAAPGRFQGMAQDAAMAGVWAGAVFPSDAEAGLALGRKIGELAVAYGKADGSDASWDKATMPQGPGIWQPTPPKFADPLVPLGGTWETWVLSSGDALRPAAPPAYASPLWQAELAAVQAVVAHRTLDELRLAQWYQNTALFSPFNTWAHALIQRAGLDLPHAVRVMAYVNVAYADAATAVWDAKYTWWTSRPITEDPTLALAFPTPPYPAYPSGYSSSAGAGP